MTGLVDEQEVDGQRVYSSSRCRITARFSALSPLGV
jgi:hypothetical protein